MFSASLFPALFHSLKLGVLGLTAISSAALAAYDPQDWEAVRKEAEGQTVYFHAWGGQETINSYIKWVGDQLEDEYNITLKHVKITDTANVVSQVLAEKSANKTDGGSVDLVWINGENFASMKKTACSSVPLRKACQTSGSLMSKTSHRPAWTLRFLLKDWKLHGAWQS